MELNKLICGDNVDILKTFPDNVFDMGIMSPPYDGLRDYNGYAFDFNNLAPELYRTLKLGGTLVWIVGDAVVKGSETGTSFRQALYFKDEVGFNIHDTMIYQKSGSLPSSNRYVQVFEYMFVFTKGKPKTFNALRDKKNNWAGSKTFGKSSHRNKDGTIPEGKQRVISEYGMRENIWKYANGFGFGQTDKLAYEHPATFPEKLVEDHIITWSNPGDLVLDAFVGSGTTAKICKKLDRNYIGIDISQQYIDLAERRILTIDKTKEV